MRGDRGTGFAVITAVYLLATVAGAAVFWAMPQAHLFVRILAADVVATVVVYLAGVLARNASVYDPYWSVAPVVICTALALWRGTANLGVGLLLVAIWYWGVRLTANWAGTFRNLDTQDWRYDGFQARYPRAFWAVSLFGIHLFPTAVVYLCLLPAVVFLQDGEFNALTFLGFAVCGFATTLQLVADRQLRRFRLANPTGRSFIRTGVWRHSRHPNYLGEILMWWGIYLMMLSSAPQRWFLLIGPLANTLMFLFVSIPMADRRNRARRPGFEEYVRRTNSLLPWRLHREIGEGRETPGTAG